MTLQEIYDEYREELFKQHNLFLKERNNVMKVFDMEMHLKMCVEIAKKMGVELSNGKETK